LEGVFTPPMVFSASLCISKNRDHDGLTFISSSSPLPLYIYINVIVFLKKRGGGEEERKI